MDCFVNVFPQLELEKGGRGRLTAMLILLGSNVVELDDVAALVASLNGAFARDLIRFSTLDPFVVLGSACLRSASSPGASRQGNRCNRHTVRRRRC